MHINQHKNVVLAHGIFSNGHVFNNFAQFMQANGYTTFAVNFHPNDGSADIEELANQLDVFIKKNTKR